MERDYAHRRSCADFRFGKTGGTAIRESGALGRERELRELPARSQALRRTWRRPGRVLMRRARRSVKRLNSVNKWNPNGRRFWPTRPNEVGSGSGSIPGSSNGIGIREDASTRLAELDRSGTETGKQLEDLDAELAGLTSELMLADRLLMPWLRLFRASSAVKPRARELAFRDAERQIVAIEERLNAERRSEAALEFYLTTKYARPGTCRASGAGRRHGREICNRGRDRGTDAEIAVIEEAVEIATQDLDPLIDEYDKTVERLAKTEAALEREREGLIEAERTRGQSGVDVERVRGEEYALRQRILDELDLDDPNVLLEDDQTPGEPNRDSEDAEHEIARLKERLRRVGYAGEKAIEDYERENERTAS